MTVAHVLGLPRVGAKRELKFALETYWKDTSNTEELAKLQDVAKTIRAKNWAEQASRGMDYVTVGDFAWYDHVLGTLSLLGAIPTRHGYNAKELTLQQYFIMARGSPDMFAMEMTKWFDTNYHYLAPEWTADTVFNGGCNWLYEEIAEAHALGHKVKVVITGPLTLLYLGKIKSGLQHKLDLLPACVAGYASVLAKLKSAGVAWVQIDEPILAFELEKEWLEKFAPTYATLKAVAPSLLLATYFDSVAEHKDLLYSLPVAGIHIDCVRGASQLSTFVAGLPQDKILSVGIVSGRNIWRADLDVALATLKSTQAVIGDRLWVASSCSLLHVPVDLSNEVKLDAEIKSWMAYGFQKITEVSLLKQALDGGDVTEAFAAARASRVARTTSPRVTHPPVQERVKGVTPAFAERKSGFATRIAKQQAKYNYPAFPTTTIGSFPQTKEIRSARAQYKSGKLSSADYKEKMFGEIDLVVRKQEEIGLDVFVHGEPERNDMVEYFGELLSGYTFSDNGWVQSYGSRCVKPPIIFGDVYRPPGTNMTVEWSKYAQSKTSKPMKGMLTGPVTMLCWSFVRDDQPRAVTALQIALALRDEVVDLQNGGIGMIQIDEPAFREGLPLKEANWPEYLDWAVNSFRICAAGVTDETQIHTHMCYSEFNDVLPWIAKMDADVITIETSRSDMKLLDAFGKFHYPNDIGPGVYDIHSPRLPRVEEMKRMLQKAREVVPDKQLWVNPDCGLKTRSWLETEQALKNMVEAAVSCRNSAKQ